MSYLAILESTGRNYAGFVPDVDGATGIGETREAALESLAQGLALMLLDLAERGVRPPTPSPRGELDPSAYDAASPIEIVEVEPAPLNPLSLEIERAIARAGLSEAEVARRMGTSKAALTRITDPFYWGHSFSMVRRFAEAVGAEVEVSFHRRAA